MARAIWTGSINFGLVAVPVRLYPATRQLDLRFRELDRLTGRPVRHQRVREPAVEHSGLPSPAPRVDVSPGAPLSAPPERAGSGPIPRPEPLARPEPATRPEAAREVVASEEVVKGFEVAPEHFVTVSAAELEERAPERSRTIDVEQFVAAAAVDPVYFATPYYVVPARDHLRPFAVLLDAMHETATLGICWITLRRKRHLAALRTLDGLMLLTTMLHA